MSGWRKLPHLKREVEKLFDCPQQFAEDIFDRIPESYDESQLPLWPVGVLTLMCPNLVASS